nr:MAG: hypothetical protein [Bacteriophage sp.]
MQHEKIQETAESILLQALELFTMVYMWTYDFDTRRYKQIQLWFNVDCIVDNDVVFLPDRRYK